MIESDRLTKYYGEFAAVKNVTFQLKKGEILGFLGPNGAGKSTTMRMLTTFLYPTSGTAVLSGYDILRQPLKVREVVGYLPENAPLYEEMRVAEFLEFAAQARKVQNVKREVSRVLEQCFIEEVKDQAIHTLSKGYRQRVCFAQAIIHDPAILILDEPTAGLDPNQKNEVRKMITKMGTGKAIILSTHILDEALAICSRAIIISRGSIEVDDTPENLLKSAPSYGTLQLSVRGEMDKSLEKELKNISRVKSVDAKEEKGVYTLEVRPEPGHEISGPVLEYVKNKNLDIVSMTLDKGRLEDVFRSYTAKQETA